MVYGPATANDLESSIFSIFSARANEGEYFSYESVIFLLRTQGDIEKKRVREALENMVEEGILQKSGGFYTLNQKWYIQSLQTPKRKEI